MGKTSLHALFLAKLFSIVEVNCRFINIHPCLGSIFNVFHNKKYIDSNTVSLNATTTVINTYKKLFDVGQREVIFFNLH
jgi:hypothetical protein